MRQSRRPNSNSQDDWFDAAKRLLLSTLDHDAKFEEITARIDKWSPPHQEVYPRAQSTFLGTEVTSREAVISVRFSGRYERMLIARFMPVQHFGGPSAVTAFPPVALCGKRMPDPYVFSAMLTGVFAESLV